MVLNTCDFLQCWLTCVYFWNGEKPATSHASDVHFCLSNWFWDSQTPTMRSLNASLIQCISHAGELHSRFFRHDSGIFGGILFDLFAHVVNKADSFWLLFPYSCLQWLFISSDSPSLACIGWSLINQYNICWLLPCICWSLPDVSCHQHDCYV